MPVAFLVDLDDAPRLHRYALGRHLVSAGYEVREVPVDESLVGRGGAAEARSRLVARLSVLREAARGSEPALLVSALNCPPARDGGDDRPDKAAITRAIPLPDLLLAEIDPAEARRVVDAIEADAVRNYLGQASRTLSCRVPEQSWRPARPLDARPWYSPQVARATGWVQMVANAYANDDAAFGRDFECDLVESRLAPLVAAALEAAREDRDDRTTIRSAIPSPGIFTPRERLLTPREAERYRRRRESPPPRRDARGRLVAVLAREYRVGIAVTKKAIIRSRFFPLIQRLRGRRP